MTSWIAPAILAALLVGGSLAAMPSQAAEACCAVVAVDTANGTVTIRHEQTGKLSTIRIADRYVLGGLKVGHKVQANGLPAAKASTGKAY
jgi:Cu/Ag efflux protein CusF